MSTVRVWRRRLFCGLILGELLLSIRIMSVGNTDVQQDFSKVEIQTTSLGSGPAMLRGAGGNLG